MPQAEGRGGLLKLGPAHDWPSFTPLSGQIPYAAIRGAWNPAGLGLSVTVAAPPTHASRRRRMGEPVVLPGVQVWVDTRNSRDSHRGTRYCHQFSAWLSSADRGRFKVDVSQEIINRALEQAPRAPKNAIVSRAVALGEDGGWHCELFFQAEALNGYDPSINRALGVLVEVSDPHWGDQHLALGREFPIAEDPSLWAILDLVDPS